VWEGGGLGLLGYAYKYLDNHYFI
jgi:hypothetical protein